jgi:TM2 domain-containing membrane protein YozV
MAIQKIEGKLKMLGKSSGSDRDRKYSLIEIGDQHLQNVSITNGLDNFLHKGLDSEKPVTIWVFKSSILGIVVDEKLYASEPGTGVATWLFTSLMFGFFALFVVGIPLLLAFWFSDYPARKEWEKIVNAFPGEKVVL